MPTYQAYENLSSMSWLL